MKDDNEALPVVNGERLSNGNAQGHSVAHRARRRAKLTTKLHHAAFDAQLRRTWL